MLQNGGCEGCRHLPKEWNTTKRREIRPPTHSASSGMQEGSVLQSLQMGTEEEVTAVTRGARLCWQSSEGQTGALSREKGQKAFQKERLVRPQWGHGAWRIATVLSDTGDLRLCSRKFIK